MESLVTFSLYNQQNADSELPHTVMQRLLLHTVTQRLLLHTVTQRLLLHTVTQRLLLHTVTQRLLLRYKFKVKEGKVNPVTGRGGP
jgi:hypothetical protein